MSLTPAGISAAYPYMTDLTTIKPKRPLIPLWMLRPITGRIIRYALVITTAWLCFVQASEFFASRFPVYQVASAFDWAFLVSIAFYELAKWAAFKVRIAQ